MANHGGYRRPANPAPVSGPGSKSRRTDGRQPRMSLPDAGYGEQQAFQTAQASAPMAQQDLTSAAPQMQGVDTSSLTPFDAPTERPDEPITAGMSGGPGGGPDQQPAQLNLDEQQQARLRSYLPALINIASQPDTDPNTRAYVQRLRAELG